VKLPTRRPFKQYTKKRIDITLDHDREIRLLLAAVKDMGTHLTYSQIIEKMIDEYFEKLSPQDI
jgi:chromosome condensin MukBEF complex kleisin-like MukF subunit